MPYKVKEHLRKTKKGLVKVKEGTRKDKAKKALVIGASALVTAGLGALAYKKLGKKVVQGAVNISKKADDVAANKAKDITVKQLTGSPTPKQLKGKSYETLPDPWLDKSLTVSKSSKGLTVAKQEQKLLTPPKYDPPTKPTKGFLKEDGSKQSLKQAISSQRTLIKREPTDIKSTLKRLELGENYIKRTDSPASVRTGETYIKTANKRLATISNRRLKRKKTGLVITKGKTRNSVRNGESSMLVLTKKKAEQTVKDNPVTDAASKKKESIADTLGKSVLKDKMNLEIDKKLDDVIPGSGLVRSKVKDVKDRVEQAGRLLKELEENGDKVSGRRGFFKNTVKKVTKEAAKKPKDPTNVARGVATKSKTVIRKGSRKLYNEVEADPTIYGKKSKVNWYNNDPLQVNATKVKKVYRKPKGLLERITQTTKKVARWKSGNQQT